MGTIHYNGYGHRTEACRERGNYHEMEDGVWLIAYRGWLPGGYATLDAAKLAMKQDEAFLAKVNERIFHVDGEGRPITVEDIEAALAPPPPAPVCSGPVSDAACYDAGQETT